MTSSGPLVHPRSLRVTQNAYFSFLTRIKELLLVTFFDATENSKVWPHKRTKGRTDRRTDRREVRNTYSDSHIIRYEQINLMHRVEIWWLLAGFCPVAAITCWYSRPRMSYKDGDGLISSSSHHLSWIRDPSKFRFISQLQFLPIL